MTTSPGRTKLGYAHYVLFPDDGRRHEIIDGDHVVNPAPSPRHQAALGHLFVQLFQQIEQTGLGRVFVSPIDVELSPHDILQPDLVVVLNEHREIIIPTRIKGTPDLVVEVLSDSTRELDQVRKKSAYQRAGVPEYWIVDPQEHHVQQFLLHAGEYRLAGTHRERLQAGSLPAVQIDLQPLWEAAR